MKKEIKKEVLIYLKKQDFKGMAFYLKEFGINEGEDYFKRVFENIKNTPYLNGEIKLINQRFIGILNYFNNLRWKWKTN